MTTAIVITTFVCLLMWALSLAFIGECVAKHIRHRRRMKRMEELAAIINRPGVTLDDMLAAATELLDLSKEIGKP